ncbi:hypothetical protein L1277_001223 [Okibacterium sp. HSC-33S16]|uniref:hypothetical protein n=1 Tax=Okibacterium sp. HSC-33S16 TaxID=2910965 RepID=UPI00209D9F62|nr:hypothetical protein [Okibacterium sp. HSC-33S16]MCP2031132.1 hypothetical protein [Okibacterium sp. HSC-33S16]
MVQKENKPSALQRRIEAGKAEPISDRERAQLAQLRATYAKRFGAKAERRLSDALRSA